jgi:hypothetical protein
LAARANHSPQHCPNACVGVGRLLAASPAPALESNNSFAVGGAVNQPRLAMGRPASEPAEAAEQASTF